MDSNLLIGLVVLAIVAFFLKSRKDKASTPSTGGGSGSGGGTQVKKAPAKAKAKKAPAKAKAKKAPAKTKKSPKLEVLK